MDGRFVNPGSPKQQLLLSALLADPGRPVGTSELIHRIWGQEPPPTARSALYTYIAQLRLALSGRELTLVRQSSGYRIVVDPDRVDLHRFHSLLDGARHATSEDGALDLLTAAAGLHHGTPFEGLHSPWVDALRATIDAERRWMTIQRSEILMRCGRPTEVLPELAEAVAAEPLDESLAEHLMVALHLSGQRAAALRHYHVVRSALIDELGVDPGVSLRYVYRDLLRDEYASALARWCAAPARG
ncbi:hypothetical protein GCM10012284_06860 [Mangrovihabitans endophyticus]|uniref:OmpR/PhoB-type domain-containing protein n=2 Tax=Mangrovihabitans endophyticus TaxID=1751298 RepID=A0A8J3FL02_9ACTN|nr:hypothetical protein GCM10012284_06860 [Mangrovihabitans endophyticus]